MAIAEGLISIGLALWAFGDVGSDIYITITHYYPECDKANKCDEIYNHTMRTFDTTIGQNVSPFSPASDLKGIIRPLNGSDSELRPNQCESCGYFIVSIVSLFGPSLLSLLFTLVGVCASFEHPFGLVGERFCYSWGQCGLGLAATIATGLLHPLWFPGWLLYCAILQLTDRLPSSAKRMERLNTGRLFEKFGEAIPQAITSGLWLYNHHNLQRFGTCILGSCGDSLSGCWQELQHCASGPVISLGFSAISIVIGVIQGCRSCFKT